MPPVQIVALGTLHWHTQLPSCQWLLSIDRMSFTLVLVGQHPVQLSITLPQPQVLHPEIAPLYATIFRGAQPMCFPLFLAYTFLAKLFLPHHCPQRIVPHFSCLLYCILADLFHSLNFCSNHGSPCHPSLLFILLDSTSLQFSVSADLDMGLDLEKLCKCT